MANTSRWPRPLTVVNDMPSAQEPFEFIGRGAELRELRGALARAAEGPGLVILVRGETGVGKTRLCLEALSLESLRARVLAQTTLNPGEPFMPLRPIIDSLRATRRHAHSHVWAALQSRARWLSALLPELGVDVRTSPPAPADRHLLFECVLDAAEEASKRSGTVWLLDGMQWADEASWAFVSYAARQVADRHLIFMLLYSGDEMTRGHPALAHPAQLASDPAVLDLSVDRFSRAESQRFVQTVAGSDLSPGMMAEIVEQSAGNPRLAQELIALRLKGSDDAVPESLRVTARRRSAGLSASTRELLKVLAVVGSQADLELVLSMTPAAGDSEVTQLVEAGLVNFQGATGRASVRFSHPLLRQAVHEDIGWVERCKLHLKVAQALESRLEGPDRANRLAIVAHHRRLGGDPKGALQVLMSGAEAQRRLGDAVGAGTLHLAAVKLTSEEAQLASPRPALIWKALNSLSHAGRWADLLPLARRAWSMRGQTTRIQAAELGWYLAAGLFMTGRVAEGWALVDSEIARLENTSLKFQVPALLAGGAAMSAYIGEWERSRQLCDMAARSSDPGVRQFASCLRLFHEFQEHRDREASAQGYLAAAEQARLERQPTVQAFALWNHARMTTVVADAHDAEATGDRSGSWLGSLSRLLLGGLHLLEGRPSPAAETLDLARTELQAAVPLLAPLLDVLHAHLSLHRGDLDQARSLLRPWDAAEAQLSPMVRRLIAGAQGWLAWEEGDLDRASDRLSRCNDLSVPGGYGLCEIGPIFLPLQVDALVRVGRYSDANMAVLAANAIHENHDRFFRAAQAVASFRLRPSLGAGLEAERTAVSTPWPWMAGLAACWRAEACNDIEGAHAAYERFASIGSSRGVERATAILRRMGGGDRAHVHRKPGRSISERELQVAELVAEGLTNQAIAARLFVSPSTVATHIKHLLAKLGVRSRAQIAAWLAVQRPGNGSRQPHHF